MIQLEKEKQQQIINDLFGNLDNSFYQIIKIVEKEYPLPKFKQAYSIFGVVGEYAEKIREYDNACLLRDLLIERLAKEFVHTHVREQDDPTNKYWILKENELDFSIESLNVLDGKNTYTHFFKNNFCKSHLLPLITGDVLHTILKNSTQHGWEVRYADNIYQLHITGIKEIVPFDYIKCCFDSGFKYIELYNCLQVNIEGLSENYRPWRRQYLSDTSNP